MYFRDDPEVSQIIEKCSEKVAAKFPNLVEAEDLAQEAFIRIATHSDYADRNMSYGLIYRTLYFDLLDIARVEATRLGRTVTIESDEGTDPDADYEYEPMEIPDGAYNRELVAFLLPGVWDESYCYSLPRQGRAPDPDMPKGSSNKAQANNLPAYIADIKTGWKETRLTLKERRAVLLRYGLGMTLQEIGEHEGCSKQVIGLRIESAVFKIVNRLNGGKDYYEHVE